ncbi:MAG TPA: hypothetical protein VF465_02125, partial [Flavobacterium sp.]
MSFGQTCNVVTNPTFTGNANGWTLNGTTLGVPNGWYYESTWAPNEIYIEKDGASDLSLKQNITGLINGPVVVSFRIKGQNADRMTCNTSATLDVKIGGITYMRIANPANNSVIGLSDITTYNLATYTQTGFPITVGGPGTGIGGIKPGIAAAALTYGTITLTIPSWTGATSADLEFVASTSNSSIGSGTCIATSGGDDWFLDNISVFPTNPTVYSVTGTSICSGGIATIGLSGSQIGVNYQLQLAGVNVGTAISGTGSAISFGDQTAIGVYTIVASPGSTTCTTTMTGNVTISPILTAAVNIAASPAGAICYGNSVTFTATPNDGGTTPVYQWKLNGVNVGTNSATYTNATLLNSDVVSCVMTSNATPCLTGSPATSNSITITSGGPTATGVTICAGGTGSLTSSSTCASTPVTLTKAPTAATNGSGTAWTNPTSVYANDNSYARVTLNSATSAAIRATGYDFSAIPNNATITNVEVIIGRYASNTFSIRDVTLNLIVGGSIAGASNLANTAASWGTSESAVSYSDSPGNWGYGSLTVAQVKASTFGVSFSVREYNGNSRTAYVDYINLSVTYTIPGSLDWYTVSSGGTSIGSGASFNPVGVSGSGLTNTNTAGTTTYYLECSNNAGCRTPVAFIINAVPTIAAISSPSALCSGGSLNPTAPTVTSNGSTVTASGWQLETTVGGGTYANLTVPYTVAFADNGKRIRYYATNGCGTTNSNTVVLTINDIPTIATISSPSALCSGGSLNPTAPTVTSNGS